MKNLSPRKKAAVLAIFFTLIIPWIAVFVLDFFFMGQFPKQVYVYKPNFCFFLPESCQAIPRTSGDLDFYCQDGQSAKLKFTRETDEYLKVSKVISEKNIVEAKIYDVSFEGKVYQLTTKVLEDKKHIYPTSCDTSIAAPKTPAESPKEF